MKSVTIRRPELDVLQTLKEMPPLPGEVGWTGMFAGESKGIVFCFGGANFPENLPWDGGIKKWYDDIYMLKDGINWQMLDEKLPFSLGYGVSASYNGKIIIIGGNNEASYSDKVIECEWNGRNLDFNNYPCLPRPLANMTGTVVNTLVIVAGGNNFNGGAPVRECFCLDLENVNEGWFELPPWPGPGRMLAMCASDNGRFYLFGGETIHSTRRLILNDCYRLIPYKSGGTWTGLWRPLSPLPKGISSAGNPLPVLKNRTILLWGGVDPLTVLYKDPKTHPGISDDVLLYSIDEDSWEYVGRQDGIQARVTLPVIKFNDRWMFISGETKPGMRTSTVYQLEN